MSNENRQERLENVYNSGYSCVCESARGGIASKVLHKSITFHRDSSSKRTLEIGAGLGEHIPFVKNKVQNYYLCDLREYLEKDQNSIRQISSSNIETLHFITANAEKLPFESSLFDSIIVTCLFHHLNDVESAILELYRVLANGGTARIFLPTDPGIAYRILREVSSMRRARILGMYSEFKYFHAKEHKNHHLSLMELFKRNVPKNEIQFKHAPFIFNFMNINLYTTITIKKI
jgi:ubiquinone/menaquinone biosynthesis C-methylase UbiE